MVVGRLSLINRFIANQFGVAPKRVIWFLGTLVAVLIGSVMFYEANVYPHGPRYFTGHYEERCSDDGTRGCRNVPVYKEDTSQLNNPAWVTLVRNIGALFRIASLGIAHSDGR